MILFWSGKGWIVPALTFGLSTLMEIFTEFATLDKAYYQTHGWPLAAALTMAGAACSFMGRRLRESGCRLLVDPATGQQVLLEKVRHTFMFVRVEHCGVMLLIAAGAVAMFKS